MDFFSGSKPNLISNNTLDEINNLLGGYQIPANLENNSQPKLNDGITDFYSNYISPNLFFIVLAILFLLFLYWKYETKNSENSVTKSKNKEKKLKDKEKEIKKKIEEYTDKKREKKIERILIDDYINSIEADTNEKSMRPQGNYVANFNPSVPVSAQQSYTNYMDNNVPLNINNKRQTPRQFFQDEEPEYNYLPFIKNKIARADTYYGTNNDYNNFVDQNYPNPNGWEQNYNESTYNAIEFATQKNKNSLTELNDIINQTNNELARNIMYN